MRISLCCTEVEIEGKHVMINRQHFMPDALTQRLFTRRVHISIALLTLCLLIAGVIVALPRPNGARAAGSATLTISPTASAYPTVMIKYLLLCMALTLVPMRRSISIGTIKGQAIQVRLLIRPIPR